MELKFARRMANMKTSAIRDIMKVIDQPNIISFAGGLPAPELFPIQEIIAVNKIVLEESGEKALQYSNSEGYAPLRKWVAERMNKNLKTAFSSEGVLITHGSQQALDLSGKVFLDEGDIVLCESPTYLAALNAFKAYGCEFIDIATDDDGMVMSDLIHTLENNNNIKLIYVIPDFQNPTGRTWSLERRQQLAEISAKYNIAVFEDNPYGELRFEGEFLPSVKSFDKVGNVLVSGTFSKIFCPGYRIGWIAGDKSLIDKHVMAKQGSDLQCNTLAQMEISKYLELYDIDKHIETIRKVYKNRRNLAIETMEKEFPKEAIFTRPSGGLFAWVVIPAHIDAKDVLQKCVQRNVAFVPGGSFFSNGGNENTFRLNFSNMPEDKIVEGLTIVGSVLKEFI